MKKRPNNPFGFFACLEKNVEKFILIPSEHDGANNQRKGSAA
jgi:hypothetical protein